MAKYFAEALKQFSVSQEIIDTFLINSKSGKPQALLVSHEGYNPDFNDKFTLVCRKLDDLVLVGGKINSHLRSPFHNIRGLNNNDTHINRFNSVELVKQDIHVALMEDLWDEMNLSHLFELQFDSVLGSSIGDIRNYFDCLKNLFNNQEKSKEDKIKLIKETTEDFEDELPLWDSLVVKFRRVESVDEAKYILNIIKIIKNSDNYDWIVEDMPDITMYQYFEALAQQYINQLN